MIKGLKSFFKFIDTISTRLGDALSILIVVIMLFTTVEVVLRYVFNSPTIWVWPVNRQIFGVYILFAGIYSMSKSAHIRIEIFQNLLSGRVKQAATLIGLFSFSIFIGVLIFKGAQLGKMSWMIGETANGAFRIPLYPLKVLIPVTAVLFLLEGIYILSGKKPQD